MARKLRVYRGIMTVRGSAERFNAVVMATSSKRKFMDKTGLTTGFCAETGNPVEVAAAQAQPEVLLFKNGPDWSPPQIEMYQPVPVTSHWPARPPPLAKQPRVELLVIRQKDPLARQAAAYEAVIADLRAQLHDQAAMPTCTDWVDARLATIRQAK